MAGKKGFLLCVCQCPSFQKMNIFEVINELRKEKVFDFVALLPQLCAEDGEEFLKNLLANKNIEKIYVGACDPRMQQKMFRDAFEKVDFDKSKHFAVDIRNMTTEQAIEAVKNLVKENP